MITGQPHSVPPLRWGDDVRFSVDPRAALPFPREAEDRGGTWPGDGVEKRRRTLQ